MTFDDAGCVERAEVAAAGFHKKSFRGQFRRRVALGKNRQLPVVASQLVRELEQRFQFLLAIRCDHGGMF